MHDLTRHALFALFNLGGGEIILPLALVLILFGAKKLPELARGLGRGIIQFRNSTRGVAGEIDDAASEAGRSVGGIYGKRAFQALSPDNQVAELYRPAVPPDDSRPGERTRGWKWLVKRLWRWMRSKVAASR